VGVGHEHRIAGSRQLDRRDAVGEARAGRDGDRLAPAEDPKALVRNRRDTRDDGAFSQFAHAAKCSRSSAC